MTDPESVIEEKTLVNKHGEKIDADAPVAPNYRYWQEHGSEWADEYESRKQEQIRYHIQEWMIVDYVRRLAERKADSKLRVLEYGCGVGRHLRNLVSIPNVEVFGFDQSQTMVEGCLRWTSRDWLDEHVAVGEPTGRLPFPDADFDLVYSSEVLVHVRPEDLPGRLREMMRVSSGHVLNIEPSAHYQIKSDVHFGCWNHDIVSAYDSIGVRCEVLPSGFFSQTPYRVDLDAEAPEPGWCPVSLALMRRMEEDINAGRDGCLKRGRTEGQRAGETRAADKIRAAEERNAERVADLEERLNARKQDLAQSHERRAALDQKIESLREEAAELRGQADESGRSLKEAQKKTASAEQRVGELRAVLEQARSSLRDFENATREMRQRISQLEREKAGLDAIVERVREERREASRDALEARAEAEGMRDRLELQIETEREGLIELERRRQDDRALVARLAARQHIFVTRAKRMLGDSA